MNRGSGAASSSGRMRIRAFPATMDEEYVAQTWELLKKAIQEIQRKNNSGLSFEELYRNAYTMVLHKHGERVYTGLKNVVKEHLESPNVRERVIGAMNSRFLETINEVWTDHTTAMVMIRDILMYMDRVYVQQSNVEPVYDLGLSIFRDEIIHFEMVGPHLRFTLVDMINQERLGGVVNWTAIKTACSMLLALGINSRSVYEEFFERTFLEDTARFYKLESQKFIAQNSAGLYVRKVKRCLELETERADRFLDAETKRKLLEVLDEVLIVSHMHTVVEMENSGVVAMLKEDRPADLADLYSLLKRVAGGLQLMSNAVSAYLRDLGKRHTDSLSQPDSEKNPVEYIQERFDGYLAESFENDALFKQKIQGDFEYFLNLNQKNAEYLCLFIDDKLKKGIRNLNDVEQENLQEKAMVLFRFLEEKDVFEKYYKQLLAKRLLLNKSASDDAEKQLISRLKIECGCQFTSKLEGMFKDMELSSSLNSAYRDYCTQQGTRDPVEINVRVLTTGFWPTQHAQACTLPPTPHASFENFERFYQQKHTGRKLSLNCILGSADVKAVFYGAPVDSELLSQKENEAGPSTAPPPAKKSRVEQKILQVSTQQMVVLLTFNERPRWTFAELLEATQIRQEHLTRTLQSLAMGKMTQRILVRKGVGKDMEDKDEFQVNDAFTSKLTRIKVQTVTTRNEAETEIKDARTKIEEDRKHEIEAAVVRIMKARKRMTHNNLVGEVMTQLKGRFPPNIQIIKRRVESLLERDYLARDSKDPKVYEYVA